VVFVRLQHAEGSFESSSQQNSAPGQAIIGSHADGNTLARLVKAGCFLSLLTYQFCKHYRILYCSLVDCQLCFSRIERAGMQTYRLSLYNFPEYTLMDMAFLNLATDIDCSTCRCVLAHNKYFLVDPENMVSRTQQMFRQESSKMLPVARFARAEVERLPLLCCASSLRLEIASGLKVACNV
jgi:hypothetical protein